MRTTKDGIKFGQIDQVFAHMKTYGSITSMEAFERYGITRLSAVIFNIRKFAEVDTIDETGKNRYGESCRYARYKLHDEKQGRKK